MHKSWTCKTYRVISDLKLLNRDVTLFRNVSQQEGSLSIGSISLVGVCLDDNTSIDSWCMVRLVSLSVVGVDLSISLSPDATRVTYSMSHVSRNQETVG